MTTVGGLGAVGGNGGGFEVEEGGLGQGFFTLGDFEAALVFTDVAAELVGDEVLDNGHRELRMVNY